MWWHSWCPRYRNVWTSLPSAGQDAGHAGQAGAAGEEVGDGSKEQPSPSLRTLIELLTGRLNEQKSSVLTAGARLMVEWPPARVRCLVMLQFHRFSCCA